MVYRMVRGVTIPTLTMKGDTYHFLFKVDDKWARKYILMGIYKGTLYSMMLADVFNEMND